MNRGVSQDDVPDRASSSDHAASPRIAMCSGVTGPTTAWNAKVEYV
jgi:hypothetical protein